MNELSEYIWDAIRYATEETGLKDWSDFIVLVNEFEMNGRNEIWGMPVYVVPSRVMYDYTFALSYLWDIDMIRSRAMNAILEYQELHEMEEQ